MPYSEIIECQDCLEDFCTTCDEGWDHCPDCHQPMCAGCILDASNDDRKGRCYICHDPGTADIKPERGNKFNDRGRFKDFDTRQQYAPKKGKAK